jgi:chromosome segregation ATPase
MSQTLATIKDRSHAGLKAAIHRLEVSRDQYRTDLAEANDKIKVIEAAMAAMQKKYTAYAKESQCPTVQLLCSLVHQDIGFITKVTNNPATDLINH